MKLKFLKVKLFGGASIKSLPRALTWCLFLVLLLSQMACAAKPEIIKVSNGDEGQLSCEQLMHEMTVARQANIKAHEEDNFKLKYMFPPTGFMSVVNIWRAGDNAVARMKLLKEVADSKNCNLEINANNIGEDVFGKEVIVLAQYFSPTEQSQMSAGGFEYNNAVKLSSEPGRGAISQVAEPAANMMPQDSVVIPTAPASAKEVESTDVEENPDEIDAPADEYIKNGYDSEVFPNKDPKHFTF